MMKDYLAGSCARFHVYRFPAYAPELNPGEYVWTQTKRHMANATPQDVDELSKDLRIAIRKLGSSQQLLKACLLMSSLFS
jgi:transposase